MRHKQWKMVVESFLYFVCVHVLKTYLDSQYVCLVLKMLYSL